MSARKRHLVSPWIPNTQTGVHIYICRCAYTYPCPSPQWKVLCRFKAQHWPLQWNPCWWCCTTVLSAWLLHWDLAWQAPVIIGIQSETGRAYIFSILGCVFPASVKLQLTCNFVLGYTGRCLKPQQWKEWPWGGLTHFACLTGLSWWASVARSHSAPCQSLLGCLKTGSNYTAQAQIWHTPSSPQERWDDRPAPGILTLLLKAGLKHRRQRK